VSAQPTPAPAPRPAAASWWRAVRPHQWLKNLLLLLPPIAAHLPWSGWLLWRLARALVAFSLVASALYLVNDVLDREQDRRHPLKRLRPVASGQLRPGQAVAGAVGLALAAALLALGLPAGFAEVLVAYAALSALYSTVCKPRPALDVIALATLYAARLLAGAMASGIVLSRWFAAFSVFFFLSLALAKRVVELTGSEAGPEDLVGGRGYSKTDVPVLAAFGAAAAAADALVYVLYLGDDAVRRLYAHPEMLWVGLPILLYWQARVWLFTGRGRMPGDPVVFAMRDRVTWLLMAGLLAAVVLAT